MDYYFTVQLLYNVALVRDLLIFRSTCSINFVGLVSKELDKMILSELLSIAFSHESHVSDIDL